MTTSCTTLDEMQLTSMDRLFAFLEVWRILGSIDLAHGVNITILVILLIDGHSALLMTITLKIVREEVLRSLTASIRSTPTKRHAENRHLLL